MVPPTVQKGIDSLAPGPDLQELAHPPGKRRRWREE